jgi:hypothetical protein
MVISVLDRDSVERWDLLTEELFLGRGIVLETDTSTATDMRRQRWLEALGFAVDLMG